MENDLKEARENELRTLIQEDQDKALAAFRKGNFETRVRARIAETAEETPRPWYVPRSLSVPAVALAFAIIAVAVAAVIMFRPRSSPYLWTAGDIRGLRTALEASPGVKILSEPRTWEAARPGSQAEDVSSFERTLGLIRAEKQTLETGAAPDLAEKPVRRLSSRDRVRILYRDRVIERALLLALEKSKEV
ncbi:MAG: hypothetical protein WCC00_07735 [Candidatus Aminicenantales bacterium]